MDQIDGWYSIELSIFKDDRTLTTEKGLGNGRGAFTRLCIFIMWYPDGKLLQILLYWTPIGEELPIAFILIYTYSPKYFEISSSTLISFVSFSLKMINWSHPQGYEKNSPSTLYKF